MVGFMSRHLHCRHPVERMLSGPQSFKDNKSQSLPDIEPWFLGHPARSLVSNTYLANPTACSICQPETYCHTHTNDKYFTPLKSGSTTQHLNKYKILVHADRTVICGNTRNYQNSYRFVTVVYVKLLRNRKTISKTSEMWAINNNCWYCCVD